MNDEFKAELVGHIKDLFRISGRLAEMSVKYGHTRKFTPDGHLVGSLGELIAAQEIDLELAPMSQKAYDATFKSDKKKTVEIKATFRDRVAFRRHENEKPAHCVVLKLYKNGTWDLPIYNGPYDPIDKLLHCRKPSNGQIQVTITDLQDLQKKLNQS